MTNWELYRQLCRVIGGAHPNGFDKVIACGRFAGLFELAEALDLLPSLAVRVSERPELLPDLPSHLNDKLHQALLDNTQRNLRIKAQAIKLTRLLNETGIEPLFLKGTAQLLTNPEVPAGFRKQVDIDLLLGPAQIQTACEALIKEGYRYYDTAPTEPEAFTDIGRALRMSEHHRHLPPLAKPGYDATVEIHKQPLARRFQTVLSAQHLLESAVSGQTHEGKFLLPSSEHHILHLVLGAFLHDNYFARFDFPLRAGCDYLAILNQNDAAFARPQGPIEAGKFEKSLQIFEQLLAELMDLPDEKRLYARCGIRHRMKVMENRYNSPAVAQALDLYGRWRYLGTSLLYDSRKLGPYIKRRLLTKVGDSSTCSLS